MISIKDLNVFYGGVHALKGISLDVPQGSIVTLLGANGAGKSTTLRAICGLVECKNGRIEFDGTRIDNGKTQDIIALGIALVPEGRRMFKDLTVKENLVMGAWLNKDKKQVDLNIERVFSLFPVLKERSGQKSGTLSGGEQQMLAISRALMSNPKLLMMDEPSLGLAPFLVSQLFHTIRQIHHEDNMTILLVEQNAKAALKIADFGYVLETGSIILQGSAADLINNEQVQKAYIG